MTVLAGLDDRHPARLLRWLRTLQAAAGRMTSETIAIAAPAVGGTALDPDALADAVDEIVAGEPTWAGGVSAALARARGEYVAYVPAGASPQEGWLDHAVAAAGSAAVVGAKVLHPRNGRVLHAGVAFFEDDTGLWFVQLYRGFRGEHPAVNRRRVVQAVSPIGAVVRRQAAVEAIGGVPTDLESELLATIDLCVRVRERGQTVVYAPVTVGCDDAALLARARARGEPGRAARWLGRVEPDLERHLDDDGFALRREAATASYTIEPTRR